MIQLHRPRQFHFTIVRAVEGCQTNAYNPDRDLRFLLPSTRGLLAIATRAGVRAMIGRERTEAPRGEVESGRRIARRTVCAAARREEVRYVAGAGAGAGRFGFHS